MINISLINIWNKLKTVSLDQKKIWILQPTLFNPILFSKTLKLRIKKLEK